MKRFFKGIIAILGCAVIFAGCNNEPNTVAQETAPTTPALSGATAARSEGFSPVLWGNTVRLGQDIYEVLDMLGEPMYTFEQPSCAFEGIDRFFLFGGVQIQTYPAANGQDLVHTVMLTDDSVATASGIHLGSSLASVLAAYGNDYEYAFGLYIFTHGATTLRFLVTDDMVTSISYELLV